MEGWHDDWVALPGARSSTDPGGLHQQPVLVPSLWGGSGPRHPRDAQSPRGVAPMSCGFHLTQRLDFPRTGHATCGSRIAARGVSRLLNGVVGLEQSRLGWPPRTPALGHPAARQSACTARASSVVGCSSLAAAASRRRRPLPRQVGRVTSAGLSNVHSSCHPEERRISAHAATVRGRRDSSPVGSE